MSETIKHHRLLELLKLIYFMCLLFKAISVHWRPFELGGSSRGVYVSPVSPIFEGGSLAETETLPN